MTALQKNLAFTLCVAIGTLVTVGLVAATLIAGWYLFIWPNLSGG